MRHNDDGVASQSVILAAALEYAELGYHVFPVRYGEKVPATAHGHLDATADEQRIALMFGISDRNIGINVGKSGVIVIDVDPRNGGDLSFDKLLEQVSVEERQTILAATRSRTPNGGWHYFFRSSPDADRALRNGRSKAYGRGVDLQAGSKCVVVPPSRVQIDGVLKPYAWDVNLTEPTRLPVFPTSLVRLFGSPARQHTPEGNGTLTHHGATIIIPEGRRLPPALKARITENKLIRIGARDNTVHSHACDLLGYGWSKLEACRLLCALVEAGLVEQDPADPFDEQRVLRKVESAEATLAKRHSAHDNPKLLTMQELLESSETPPTWLVEGLLIDGGTSLLCSKPKVGKSTLARQLAMAIARGKPFLGRSVAQGAVLYIDLESNLQRLAADFKIMGATRNDRLLFHIANAPNDAIQWLDMITREHTPKLIIIDTLQRFTKMRDVNDYAAVTNALDPLTRIARDTGAHLMLLHHSKKAGGEYGDAVLGSTGIFGAVDTLAELKRRDERRMISSQQRYGDDLPSTVLRFDSVTRAVECAGTANEARVEDCLEEIVFLLSEQPWQTKAQLFNQLACRLQTKHAALALGRDSGSITQSGDGKKGAAFRFAVAEQTESIVVPTIGDAPLEPQSVNSVASVKLLEIVVPQPSNAGQVSEAETRPSKAVKQ